MSFPEYATCFVLFGLVSTLLLYGIPRLQRWLPWYPAYQSTPLPPDLAMNTAISYTSSFANNGQAFGGLNANTAFCNLTAAIAMLAGRFGLAVPALAFAGLSAGQKNTPVSVGLFPPTPCRLAFS